MRANSSVVLVQGPYLVRSAAISGSRVVLTGDVVQSSTNIEVFAPKSVDEISWNGEILTTTRTNYGSIIASSGQAPSIQLPSYGSWKWSDSLPERFADYDDSGAAWVGTFAPFLDLMCYTDCRQLPTT